MSISSSIEYVHTKAKTMTVIGSAIRGILDRRQRTNLTEWVCSSPRPPTARCSGFRKATLDAAHVLLCGHWKGGLRSLGNSRFFGLRSTMESSISISNSQSS